MALSPFCFIFIGALLHLAPVDAREYSVGRSRTFRPLLARPPAECWRRTAERDLRSGRLWRRACPFPRRASATSAPVTLQARVCGNFHIQMSGLSEPSAAPGLDHGTVPNGWLLAEPVQDAYQQ